MRKPRRAGRTRVRFTKPIAEPDTFEEAVTKAVNDTPKAIAAREANGKVVTMVLTQRVSA